MARAALMLFLALSLTACPKQAKRTLPEIPTTGDAQARQRFHQARERFKRDQHRVDAATVDEFQAIEKDYPNDPIAPFARLYAGIAAVKSGRHEAAIESLSAPHTDAGKEIRARSRLYLGFALVGVGRAADAAGPLRDGQTALEGDAERALWWASSAEALAASGDASAAIGFYDRWFDVATGPERAYIGDRVLALVADVSDDEARALFDDAPTKDGPLVAIVGARVATLADSAGDRDRARSIARDIGAARQRLGLSRLALGGGGGDPQRVGAAIPLSGRRGRVGESANRALTLAAGVFEGGGLAPFALAVEDSGSTETGAGRAIDALSKSNVVAVIGPTEGKAVNEAARRASPSQLAVLSLDPRARSGDGQRNVFHIMHSAEARARTLAAYAVNKGIKDFAILGPKNGYGRAVGAAFRQEVVRLGGRVTVESWYAPGETNFKKSVARLRKPWTALFVPDLSSRLELVAPALAAANFVTRAHGSKKPRRGRAMQLLSTAEAVGERFLRTTGRYASGAVLAPGFVADPLDPTIGGFSSRFRTIFGRSPTALEAYAYDAARAIRAAVEGERDRGGVVRALRTARPVGLTGTLSFDAGGRRSDSGLLFQVRRSDTGEYVARAMR